MLSEYKRLESVISRLQNAVETSDRLQSYRLSVVVLRLIIEQHKRLEQTTDKIQVLNTKLRQIPDTKLKHAEHYRHNSSGWGRSRSHIVGTPGSLLRPLNVLPSKEYHELVTESVMLQLRYNEELTLLQQYAEQFKKLRTAVIGLHPRNEQQRLVQCVLARTEIRGQWDRDEVRQNPILNCICGRFYATTNMAALTHKLLKNIDDNKRKIGRFSLSHANTLISKLRNDYTPRNVERYNGKRGKVERACNVENYVKNSPRYQSLLSWIVGLKNIQQALAVVRYAADWKERYQAVDRLCRSVAVRRSSYVETLFTSQPIQCGTIRHLETDIPVYSSTCIVWETRIQNDSTVYWLGKTGSTIVDDAISSVDWYHCRSVDDNQKSSYDREAIEHLRNRLGYAPRQKITLAERRKELATYARKLVWLESISMLDSKAAGNCLPGTIQFCQTLGINVPQNWSDTSVDTRKLLRAWKSNGYGVNRLLLPAIDSAVNRVKAKLLSVVACYVPSVVK